MKIYARLAFGIYCPHIIINRPEFLKAPGPLLFACNHPNSFLDGIILTTLCEQPLFSLARGDAFKKKNVRGLLTALKLLPVYRTSEGAENLEHNYTTFNACLKVFEKKENVLIFSEGRCVNEWHLRPLKKGTARLAISAWKNNMDLKVIPTGINYSSFFSFGKEVHIYFGTPLSPEPVLQEATDGLQLNSFNQALSSQLKELVYEIPKGDEEKRTQFFPRKKQGIDVVLFLPAIAGWLLHAPLLYMVKSFAYYKFRESDHFDSVLVALLFLLYPFYLIAIFFLAYSFIHAGAVAIFVMMPLLAKAATRIFMR